jgi:hypothetical protein
MERGGEREREKFHCSLLPHQHPQAPPSGYMFSPGAYQSSTTPTFMEDLEDPNPPVDPETVNREFYQLDKVREAVLIFDKCHSFSTNARRRRYYLRSWMM